MRRRPRTKRRKRSRLPERPGKSDAFATALKALNRRERTTAQIREWLLGRGFADDHVSEAIDRLTAAGTLDDERFAECFAADRRELSGWGQERIEAALIKCGIERGLAERAAGEDYAEQAQRAARLLEQRAQSLDDEDARGRALGFLTRRGFAYEVAYDAIRGVSAKQR